MIGIQQHLSPVCGVKHKSIAKYGSPNRDGEGSQCIDCERARKVCEVGSDDAAKVADPDESNDELHCFG